MITSARPANPSVDRRTLMRAAAWTAPAVTLAAASPAYASSGLGARPGACRVVQVTRSSWSVVTGGIVDRGNTGWLVRGQYDQPGMVSSAQATWFDGTKTGAGTSVQPDDSFLSFGNNASMTGATVIKVRYAFELTGSATVQLEGVVRLGYGDSGTPVQLTERQVLDVAVVDGNQNVRVAGIAHRRRNGNTYYPATADSAAYALLARTDEEVGAHHTLHTAIQGEHTYRAEYTSQPIALTGKSSVRRTVHLDYTLTLDRRASSAWVNDDVVINPPTVTVCQ
ncbi:hypothetical protein [Nocardioides daphniae]|uniref:Tat pathway signal sequence domain protein n=1 Tax=Nocardioides daphniae TaxID=402297 RepID=A0A4P7UGS8_9ACTN|nr:hypothetical protein [Nocardioides daphniae]QCC78428.1 hypothetical protein E2C04_16720 [Nocardioides daphniae]GGD12523.1 hypothetical protein GCM10007231_09390 [Nocardioides daphniae]